MIKRICASYGIIIHTEPAIKYSWLFYIYGFKDRGNYMEKIYYNKADLQEIFAWSN